MHYPLVIIGAGLAGLAAGIRMARFGNKVLILEQHDRPGGLNSYYTRQGYLLETGLHAMTNYAPPGDRHAPLNRLFRQLKLSRKNFQTHQQVESEIRFDGGYNLRFSNDFKQLQDEVARLFPASIDNFIRLTRMLDDYDPFQLSPWSSTRAKLHDILDNPLLENMLLWPVMLYGCSSEDDIDFDQFVILFRSIFQEGLFRPHGNMKDFLDLLVTHYRSLGGEILYKKKISSIHYENNTVSGIELASGETIECDKLISTAGLPTTNKLLQKGEPVDSEKGQPGKISLFETIAMLPRDRVVELAQDRTIIFFNFQKSFSFRKPSDAIDFDGGVICFPDGFQDIPTSPENQIRITHMANYDKWKQATTDQYKQMKEESKKQSWKRAATILGDFSQEIVYSDSFTPTTIERFTSKAKGAVYGSPDKQKDGRTEFDNLFIAGTDQGFLGIVGSMISGANMINLHVLLEAKHA